MASETASETASSESMTDETLPATPSGEYTADNIKLLDGIEHVRTRPDMYIGSRGESGLHHLLWEVVDNAVDEVANGFADEIRVVFDAEGTASVVDNGRGIPIDVHQESGRPAVEIVMTKLYAGGKFDNATYKSSAGLHGVGVSVVNALSEWLEVEVYRSGKVHHQRYEKGAPATDLAVTGTTDLKGTKVRFFPDEGVFGDGIFNRDIAARRLRELAYLNPKARITLVDERIDDEEVFHYPAGLVDYIKNANANKEVLHEVIHGQTEHGDVVVEFALQFNDRYDENLHSFANNVYTRYGGTHLSGFKAALTRCFNTYARTRMNLKDKEMPSGEDYREGICGVVSVKLPNPQFESQTKIKLGNAEVEGQVSSVVYAALETYLEEHPNDIKAIIDKAKRARSAREAARKARDLARERKSALSGGNLPTKLSDCTSRNVDETELFLVEGDSAGGSAKRGRNSETQAILPLKGKILNVEKASIDKVLGFAEIKMLIQAIGAGVHDDFDASKCRYGKIIIMCDADVDGSHIRTLLLTFFFRQMRELIEQGRVYAAQPPLYQLKKKKKIEYIIDDREFKTRMLRVGMEGGSFTDTISGKEATGDELGALVKNLVKLEDHARILARKGVALDRYVAARREDGSLPHARLVGSGKEDAFVFSADELRGEIESRRAKSSEYLVAEASSPLEERSKADVVTTTFGNKKQVEGLLAEIAEHGFDPMNYLEAEVSVETKARGEAPKPRFLLKSGSDEIEVGALRDLPDAVRRMGQKGLEVKRFKGLGEMNYDELWKTTMDPESRTLLRIRLEDALKADQIFTVLMGENVESRRDFIERHALEVKNLDI